MKVSKEFQDYDDDDPDIEKRKNRYKFWSTLKTLREECMEETGSSNHTDFITWLENKYGFIPIETDEGMITDNYIVVDDKKFLIFRLKYLGD